jgi:hypothetical protein
LCGDAVDEAGVRLDGTFSPIFLNDWVFAYLF